MPLGSSRFGGEHLLQGSGRVSLFAGFRVKGFGSGAWDLGFRV